jgi:hypothetical protein
MKCSKFVRFEKTNLLKVTSYTNYDFKKASEALNTVLKLKRPKSFDPLWIEQQNESLYKYLSGHVRTETGMVDWDAVTIALERRFQKRWYWYNKRKAITIAPYENKEELDIILDKYQTKSYTVFVQENEDDLKIRDKILISLVRVSQKGNVLAQQKLIDWLTFIITEWIENSKHIAKFKGYPDGIKENIQQCIRCYRYTGTFIGYLYKTFLYSARGLRSTCSLNDPIGKGNKTRVDYVIQEDT